MSKLQVPEGQHDSSQARSAWRPEGLLRVYPISAKINVWRFDGRMAFVPEGQADSSQARSAWGSDAEWPRPGGTVEVGSLTHTTGDGAIFLMIPGTSCLATIVMSFRDLEFGHFLVRVPSARRANRKQPRASVLGTTRTRKSP